MGMFDGFKTDKLDEQARDSLGFQAHDSDIYQATIKMAYAGQAKSGAKNVSFEFDLGGGKTYRETVYYTNKKGEHFYLTKNEKKAPLPGFTLMNDICTIASDKEFHEQGTEEKVLNIYDYDLKKDVPKKVPVLTDLLGKKVALAILKVLENKNVEVNPGEYAATDEERTTNRIDKALHPEYHVTVNEARDLAKEMKPGQDIKELAKEKAKFWPAWEAKNKGQVRDEREIKDGKGGPPASGGSSSSGGEKKKSLFT